MTKHYERLEQVSNISGDLYHNPVVSGGVACSHVAACDAMDRVYGDNIRNSGFCSAL